MHTIPKEVSTLLTGDLPAFPMSCSGCWADGPDGKALCSGPKTAELAKCFSLNTNKPDITAQSGLPKVGTATPDLASSATCGTDRKRQERELRTQVRDFQVLLSFNTTGEANLGAHGQEHT